MKFRIFLLSLVILSLLGCSNNEPVEVTEEEPVAGDILLLASENFDSMDNVQLESTMSTNFLRAGHKHIEKKVLVGNFIQKEDILHANEYRSFNQINGDLVNIDTEIILLPDTFYRQISEDGHKSYWEKTVLDEEARIKNVKSNMPRSYLNYLIPYKDSFEISDKSTSESYVLLFEVPYEEDFRDLIHKELESSYRLSEFKMDFENAIDHETRFRTIKYEITVNKDSNLVENFKLVVDVTLKDGLENIDIVKRIDILYSNYDGEIVLPSNIKKEFENQKLNEKSALDLYKESKIEDETVEDEKEELNDLELDSEESISKD